MLPGNREVRVKLVEIRDTPLLTLGGERFFFSGTQSPVSENFNFLEELRVFCENLRIPQVFLFYEP